MGKLFKGLASAAVSTRLEEPGEGTAQFLIDQIQMRETREHKDYVSIRTTCVHAVDGDGARVGDRYGFAVFAGDYFLKELKSWILAMVGVSGADEAQVLEIAAPKAEYPKLDDAARAELAWEKIAQQACGLDENDKPVGPGCFDGQVVIQIDTRIKAGKPTGKFVQDPVTKEMIPEPVSKYTNHYPTRQVPPSEVAEHLTDKQIAQFFGSGENFTALLKAEG
jgi:hypothetical protein